MTEHNDPEALRSTLERFSQAMLVTLDSGGAPRGRPMHLLSVRHDGGIWFASDDDSAKIDELRERPEAALTCQDNDTYVSVTGLVEIVEDEATARALWSPAMNVWFPDGPSDERMTLLRFQPVRGELWDMTGATKVRYLVEAARAWIRGERPDTPDTAHQQVSL